MSGTYQVDTSFDNLTPTIQQGTSVIATGIFYDRTPADTANRDEIAVFAFDSIDLPTGVTLAGVRNANSRPVALGSGFFVSGFPSLHKQPLSNLLPLKRRYYLTQRRST